MPPSPPPLPPCPLFSPFLSFSLSPFSLPSDVPGPLLHPAFISHVQNRQYIQQLYPPIAPHAALQYTQGVETAPQHIQRQSSGRESTPAGGCRLDAAAGRQGVWRRVYSRRYGAASRWRHSPPPHTTHTCTYTHPHTHAHTLTRTNIVTPTLTRAVTRLRWCWISVGQSASCCSSHCMLTLPRLLWHCTTAGNSESDNLNADQTNGARTRPGACPFPIHHQP
jgi:hypothetical protein